MVRLRRLLRSFGRAAPSGCADRPRARLAPPGWRPLLLAAQLVLALPTGAMAVSLQELESTPDLTAKKFASFFDSFRYELYHEVRPPRQFLDSRRGDCDDYAILADHILPEHGFETRLIHVRLAGMVAHAVCYVTEDRAYLDYNNRAVFFRLTRTDPSLRAIAEKVAASLNANWTSASEFLYSYATDRKIITATVVQTADPADDPPPRKAARPKSSLLVE